MDLKIEWPAANVGDDVLTVPLIGAQPPMFADAFADLMAVWESETRGQSWDSVRLVGNRLLVAGVDRETDKAALRTYLEHAIEAAAQEASALAAAARRVVEDRESEAQERRAQADELTREFRDL